MNLKLAEKKKKKDHKIIILKNFTLIHFLKNIQKCMRKVITSNTLY